jgi:uncharacterized membrane protein
MGLAVEILGLVLFLGAHVFVTMRERRAALISRIGFGPYRGLFSLVAIIGVVLIGFTALPVSSRFGIRRHGRATSSSR